MVAADEACMLNEIDTALCDFYEICEEFLYVYDRIR
jgi:hypothetical protein